MCMHICTHAHGGVHTHASYLGTHACAQEAAVDKCVREQAQRHGYHVGEPFGVDKNVVLTAREHWRAERQG